MNFDVGRHIAPILRPGTTDRGAFAPRPSTPAPVHDQSTAGAGPCFRPPGPAHDLRLRCRVRLLTLAADLADLGVRPRLTDTVSPPFTLRCWNPSRQGPSLEVACGPDRHGRLVFHIHPSGEFLGDAEQALEPGDTAEPARELARRLR